MELLEMIPKGKENGISNKDLQKALGVNRRRVCELIAQARKSGAVICSGVSGYYRPADTAELEEFYRINRARAISLLAVLKQSRRELIAAGVDLK